MLQADLGQLLRAFAQQVGNHGARADAGSRQPHRSSDRQGTMAVVRHEIANLQRAVVARLGHQHWLGDDHATDVAQAHGLSGLQPQRFQAFEQRAVGVQLSRGFRAADTQLAGLHHHHRHGHVDAGHRHAINHVLGLARGEQLAGLAADRVEEGQVHRGGSARHPIDRRTAFVAHDTAGRFDQRIDEGASVEVTDAHQGLAFLAFYQPLFDGEWPNRTQHVAAVGGRIDPALCDHHLHEQVVDVGVGVQ
ncbi:hypothetical protein D3C80_1239330 [compost metagenome]